MIASSYYILWQIKNVILNLLACTRPDIYIMEYFIQFINILPKIYITFEIK